MRGNAIHAAAIALHDATSADPEPLALAVGSAMHDPAHRASLEDLPEAAEAGTRPHPSETR